MKDPDTARRRILWTFFVQAFAGGGLFARIPDIQLRLGLTEAELGLALAGAASGGLLSLGLSGALVGWFGTRPILIIGLPLMAAMAVAAALAPSLALLIPALLIGGMAFSVTNVAMNVEADRIEAAGGIRVMNRCHGFWSLGMLAASLIGVGARAIPVTPALHFLVILPLVLAVTAILFAAYDAAPRRGAKTRRPGFAMPSRITLLLMAFGISASIAQSTIQNWSVIFMRDTFAAPDWIDTLTLPAFLLAMTLGRLFADGWITRFGTVAVGRGLALLAFVSALLVTLSPSLPLVILGIALQGLGTAALFPIMVTAAAEVPDRSAEENVASVILATSIVILVAPLVVGWTAETLGLRAAFALVLPFFLLTVWLAPLTRERGDHSASG